MRNQDFAKRSEPKVVVFLHKNWLTQAMLYKMIKLKYVIDGGGGGGGGIVTKYVVIVDGGLGDFCDSAAKNSNFEAILITFRTF